MKKFFFTCLVITVFQSSSHAAVNEFYKELYFAIQSIEIPLVANKMTLKYSKSLTGLTCIKTSIIEQEDSFSCNMKPFEVSASELYNNLNLEEIPMPADKMTLKFKKKIGRLSCTKTSHLLSGDNYICMFGEDSIG